ncbi:hypothetical protein M011DRAFT_155265 [Sporormia fimetaria CBS 119925]|uniref:Uncharacterized protein n=1 Tax=Sporormia fimetaria CBS 119925 TaxID=1340428 RepID=A0A6A6V3E8_9PLEO|nr:hypothetical protein M011DRAFT_155265 [Sporormia fimetaria CBS 119925]
MAMPLSCWPTFSLHVPCLGSVPRQDIDMLHFAKKPCLVPAGALYGFLAECSAASGFSGGRIHAGFDISGSLQCVCSFHAVLATWQQSIVLMSSR